MLILKANKAENCYEIQHTGEDAAEVINLFGTDTLPTPYLLQCDINEVLARLQPLNTRLIHVIHN